jgi:hypothetical protein
METKNIYAAFIAAQKDFLPALKDKTNPHFKSKYADLGTCLDAVMNSLNAHGIGLVQRTLPDDSGVTVETLFIHTSGESFSGGPLHVPAAKHDPQGFGSALTYARRYSLMAACGIAPEDDDGNASVKAAQAAKLQQRADWLDETAMNLQECKTKAELIECWNAANVVMKRMNDTDALATLKPIRDMALDAIEGMAA